MTTYRYYRHDKLKVCYCDSFSYYWYGETNGNEISLNIIIIVGEKVEKFEDCYCNDEF